MRGRCFSAVVVGALAAGMLVARLVLAGQAQAVGPPGIAGPPADVGARALVAPGKAGAAMPNIDSCVARLDPQLDIGYDRIAARCPDLMRQLDGGAWAPWLPRGWKESGNDFSAGGLKEFRALVDRESNVHDSTPIAAPDVRDLQPILTTLAGSRNENGWSRFKSWLRSILEQREQPTDESWFSRMVSHVGVSQSLIRLITYAALGGVIVLAGIIVVNEARTAGLLSGKRGRARKRRTRVVAGGVPGTGWGDIEQAPLRDRPRLLLDLIVRRLSDRGSLPPAGALTVRELTRAARLPETDDQSRLAELALAAERVRYSAVETQSAGLEEPIARGRELLNRLDASVSG